MSFAAKQTTTEIIFNQVVVINEPHLARVDRGVKSKDDITLHGLSRPEEWDAKACLDAGREIHGVLYDRILQGF